MKLSIRPKFLIIFIVVLFMAIFSFDRIRQRKIQEDSNYNSLISTAVKVENSDSSEIMTRKSDIYNSNNQKIGAAIETLKNRLFTYSITIKENNLPSGFSYVGWLSNNNNQYYLLGVFQKKYENYQLDQVFSETSDIEKVSISIERDEDLETIKNPSNIVLIGSLEPIN